MTAGFRHYAYRKFSCLMLKGSAPAPADERKVTAQMGDFRAEAW
jgi:hypothetical protein